MMEGHVRRETNTYITILIFWKGDFEQFDAPSLNLFTYYKWEKESIIWRHDFLKCDMHKMSLSLHSFFLINVVSLLQVKNHSPSLIC